MLNPKKATTFFLSIILSFSALNGLIFSEPLGANTLPTLEDFSYQELNEENAIRYTLKEMFDPLLEHPNNTPEDLQEAAEQTTSMTNAVESESTTQSTTEETSSQSGLDKTTEDSALNDAEIHLAAIKESLKPFSEDKLLEVFLEAVNLNDNEVTFEGLYQGEMTENEVPHGQGIFVFENFRTLPTKGLLQSQLEAVPSIYIGSFAEGQRDGKGTLFEYSDRDQAWQLVYEGNFSGGKLQGAGTLYTHYKGQYVKCELDSWDQGIANGLGVLTGLDGELLYKGEFKDGRAVTEDVLYFPNGTYYEGTLTEEGMRREGQGKMHYINGYYEGDWQDDLRHGYGQTFIEGRLHYKGEWIEDHMQGKGQFFNSDGDILYSGHFKNSLFHGNGIYNLPDSSRYIGDWEKGLRQGTGTFFESDGAKYEGEWLNDLFHGKGVYYYSDDYIYEGDWIEGMRQGRGILFDPEGAPYLSGTWKNNLFIGE